MDDINREDLTEDMQWIADLIGINNVLILLNELGGCTVYFTKSKHRINHAKRMIYGLTTIPFDKNEFTKKNKVTIRAVNKWINEMQMKLDL